MNKKKRKTKKEKRIGTWKRFALFLFPFTFFLSEACAARLPKLPEGPGAPLADARAAWASAAPSCSDIETLSAEVAVSGRTGGRRLRARILVGAARPASIRLVAVAPFGPPAFILVATPDRSELFLPRDRRILAGAPTPDIVDALTGVRLGADDLRAILGGCPVADPQPIGARAFGPGGGGAPPSKPGGGGAPPRKEEWRAVDLQDGATAYLRQHDGAWRVVAGTRGPLSVHFDQFDAGRPRRIRLQTPASTLTLSLSQVEVNVPLGDEVFRVAVPPDAEPLTLEELREAGPLGRR